MKIELIEAIKDDKQIIESLLEFNSYDFTEFVPDDLDENGHYGYDPIKYYWNEPGRYAYIVRANEKIAGLALIRTLNTSGNQEVYSVAEFFIMKKYRANGIGKRVAKMIFDMFRGDWEVSILEENIPARLFWQKTISEYTNGVFLEIKKDDWNGPIYIFKSLEYLH